MRYCIIGSGGREHAISWRLLSDGSAEEVYVLPGNGGIADEFRVNLKIDEAALTGDVEKLMMAVAMDPLTSAVLTLQEIRDMTAEMLEAQRAWLPQFAGKKIRPLGTISTPPGTKGVPVPLDPALAINSRFGQLATG